MHHQPLLTFLKLILRQESDGIPGPDQDLWIEPETGTAEIGTTEAGLVLDKVVNMGAGGVDPVRTVRAVLVRREGETRGVETAGAVTTGGRDLTAGHALPEGTEIGDLQETPTRRNCWATTTLLRSSSE